MKNTKKGNGFPDIIVSELFDLNRQEWQEILTLRDKGRRKG